MIRFIDTTVFLLVVLTVYAITPHQSPTNKQKRKLWVNNNSDNNTIHDQYFPNSQLVLDMATISHAVYRFKWNKFKSCHDINSGTLHNETYPIRLPNHTECLYYAHDESLGTQVLVLRSSVYNYVSVAYAGTDDWKTALADGDILMSEFGPSTLNNSTTNITAEEKQKEDDIRSLFKNVPTDVRVHRGFNSNVFANSSEFMKLLNCIDRARLGGDCDDTSPDIVNNSIDRFSTPYELITTGHSLGAASSVLLGAALHLLYPTETIRTINYGCPKIGNAEWGSYIDSRQPNQQKGSGSLEIFRFVNKIDLVPRLPELPLLVHVGHTLQMSVGGVIRAYYDHLGSSALGLASVPFGWDASSFAFLPGALDSHPCTHYISYLDFYKPNSTNSQPNSTNTTTNLSMFYYVNSFELVEKFDWKEEEEMVSSIA